MTQQQGGAPSASAGGASAPIAAALADVLQGVVKEWQRLVDSHPGLAELVVPPVVDAEILPADRKPVYDGPGLDTDWDEDTEAVLVHGVGWSLSWGCKLSIARDHDTGEHYVCVNTSGEDQRKGIVSRSTTPEQIAAFARHLLNVFGEPDPRDAEIERLRTALGEANTVRMRLAGAEEDLTEAREEWKRADAEVTRLQREADEMRHLAADLLNRTLDEVAGRTTPDMIEEVGSRWRQTIDNGCRDSERWRKQARDAEAERDRLRARLDQHLADENSAQAANDRLRTALTNAEADRDVAQANERDLHRRLARIKQETSDWGSEEVPF